MTSATRGPENARMENAGVEKSSSDKVWKTVKTENCTILGVSARTKLSQMVFERCS